jgi:hypothetical protein
MEPSRFIDSILAIGYPPARRFAMVRWSMLIMLLALAGCADTLETGYKPRPLRDSDTMRRSYYASPFTPAAKAPQMEKEQEFEARRPRPGY